MTTKAFKVFTHDLRTPVRGGDPVWSGSLPHVLDAEVDESDDECAPGWSACVTATDALRIAGLWPDGRPSRLFRLETESRVVVRGDKMRAATWTLIEEVPVDDTIRAMSLKWFGDLADDMAREQLAWRAALARPSRDAALVAQHLARALDARGLPWMLRRFDTAWAARYAWDAWDARAARAARAARYAWDARAALAAWYARAASAWDARYAWDARAALAAWYAWDARAALAALIHFFASAQKWISAPREQYTVGIRDAYAVGLSIAIPTGPNELGWAIEA